MATCGASRSASEKTATVSMPRSRHARKTRIAISPRLATRRRMGREEEGGRRKGTSSSAVSPNQAAQHGGDTVNRRLVQFEASIIELPCSVGDLQQNPAALRICEVRP